MTHSHHHRFLRMAALLVLLVATTMLTDPSFARGGFDSASTTILMDEITVTARKREEGLQDTPISISAFSGEQLDYRGVVRIDELASFTPNLVFQNNPSFGGSSNSAAIYIRGIGQADFLPLVEPGVGIYVDGVYVARSLGAILDLVDVERVEVLRGPQGTLFGRNTIGGAISVTTAKPSEAFEAGFDITGGSDSRLDVKGFVSGALGDGFFGRLSVAGFFQDGYVERPDGIDLGEKDTQTARAQFRFEPSDDVTIDFSADYTKSRENGPATTLLGINLGNPVDPNTPPFAVINNVGANLAAGGPPVPCATPDSPTNLDVPGCYDFRYVVGDDDNLGTAPSFSDSDIFGLSLSVEWALSDTLTLRSITAYRDLESEFARDGDASPLLISEFVDDLTQDQFSQELQLLGQSSDDRLTWILGGFYFEEEGNSTNLLRFAPSAFQSGGDFKSDSIAIFAQGSYAITDMLSLTAGLRWTRDKKTFLPIQQITERIIGTPPFDAPIFDPGTPILPNVEASESFKDLTPMVNLSYQVNDDLLTYATFSQGFKSGGFSQRVFPPIIPGITTPETDPVAVIPSFEPETVTSYEVGAKFTGFDGRLRLNAALYYTEYDDLQVQVFTSVAPVLENAASATIQGFELELQAAPTDRFFIEASLGLTDAEYDEIDQAETLVSADNAFERVSEWTAAAAMSYDFSLGDLGSLIPRVQWSYRSSFFNDAFNTPEIAQEGYHTLDALLRWQMSDDRFELLAGVTNIADDDYLITGVVGDAFQSYEGVRNRGRQFYLTFRSRF